MWKQYSFQKIRRGYSMGRYYHPQYGKKEHMSGKYFIGSKCQDMDFSDKKRYAEKMIPTNSQFKEWPEEKSNKYLETKTHELLWLSSKIRFRK
jgi:hypothetical protein